ncbi:MAG TPA: PLP-dependent aminotransferase family protein [Candidatus Udaeobacter sp.]|nr:PLP-dependent aminotransferase family protein [Candidatus Udaeobacter sp.]
MPVALWNTHAIEIIAGIQRQIGMSRRQSLLKKRRRRSVIAFEMIQLDRSAAEPLHEQLYRQIRDELKSGSFADAASRLPSSRALASDLGISRLTVNLAFSKLQAEGYLCAKAKSGTFVANPLPENFLVVERFAQSTSGGLPQRVLKSRQPVERRARTSDRVKAIPDQRAGTQFDLGALGAGAGVSLVPGLPAVDEFPIDIWERLRSQVLAQKGTHLLRHASSRGDADLRKAVATYLCDFRGARCHPDQILIVGGMQQAMLVSAMALLDPGETVWIEDPGFHQARRVFILAGAQVVSKPLDDEGIVIARSPKEKNPKIIHVTPSHQYPLGVTMSFRRRKALLDFARAYDAFVFEDDFYAEFRFAGPPLPCLQGIDTFGRVIYAGTMSKILYPSLRLGYVVAPETLIDSLVKIRSTMDQHSSAIDQATLARFITEGFFLSHIKRMRKIYADRRAIFIKEFNELLGDRFTLQVPEGGLNMVAWLKHEENLAKISRVALQVGVKPSPLSFYCVRAKPKPAFVFGFAGWTPAQIRESLTKLALSLNRAGISRGKQ